MIIEMKIIDLEQLQYFWNNAKDYVDTKMFIGTYEEYLEAHSAGKIKVGTLVMLTEDEITVTENNAMIGNGILGKMKLNKI